MGTHVPQAQACDISSSLLTLTPWVVSSSIMSKSIHTPPASKFLSQPGSLASTPPTCSNERLTVNRIHIQTSFCSLFRLRKWQVCPSHCSGQSLSIHDSSFSLLLPSSPSTKYALSSKYIGNPATHTIPTTATLMSHLNYCNRFLFF